MSYRPLVLVALAAPLIGAAPRALAAQVIMPARVVRRGGDFTISDGEPISFFLEHSREIELTNTQRDTLMAIRRRLRNQNAPWTRQLDSLRDEMGIDLDPRSRITDRDRDRLEKFQKLSAPLADSMRVNNDAARGEAWSLLDSAQRAKVDSIVKEDRAGRGDRRRPPRPPEY
ncbi:MAG: hypothetical protein U0163_12495 [Gemmatimonadaceae bacterium]